MPNFVDAPIPPKKDSAFYDLKLGQANPIKMAFSANPKPTEGFWMINNTKVQIGTKSKDNKYTSGQITMKVTTLIYNDKS